MLHSFESTVVCTLQPQIPLGHLKAQDREEQRDRPNFQGIVPPAL